MSQLVSLRDVRKAFGATIALSGVSFDLARGEIHALVGENGAGKSTLMNVLAGVLAPDSGSIRICGRQHSFRSIHDAKNAGIAIVFQELSLVDGLSVEENICAGSPPVKYGLVNRRAMRKRAQSALKWLGANLQPGAIVATLLSSQKQNVEIAKAIDQLFHAREDGDTGGSVLILDEPTSALTAEEKAALFKTVRILREQGVGVIYISHHLDEVLAVADRVTVLRDGATIWTRPAKDLTADELVSAMVGRNVMRTTRPPSQIGPIAARFSNVGKRGRIVGVNFDIHFGEVLAIAGLDGSGREQTARLLAGLERPDTGRIELFGAYHPGSFRKAMMRGLGYVPDERKSAGLFLDMSVAANALAADLATVTKYGCLDHEAMKREGREAISRHHVKVSDPQTRVGALSGGNQQKVLFAKWLRRNPRILLIEEPTKGVDIGSKKDIHEEIIAHARKGAAVLVVSSDLPEILEIADRILVMHRGQIAGQLAGANATEQAVMALASGSLAAVE